MLTIAEFADRSGRFICERAGLDGEVNRVCYGLEITMVIAISFGFVALFGAALGMLVETLWVAAAFLLMKIIIGGPHLSGFSRCVGLTTVIMTGGAWISLQLPTLPNVPNVVFLMMVITVLVIYAPLSRHSPNYTDQQRIIRKAFSVGLVMAAGISLIFSSASIPSGIFTGFSLSALSISPVGIFVVRSVEKITKRR